METNSKLALSQIHSNLVVRAIIAATHGHTDTNHKYGEVSYTRHLAHVADVAFRFIHLIPAEERAAVIAACWLHDSIEDVRMTYNDVVKALWSIEVGHIYPKDLAILVAEMVRAVSCDNRGRNRKERMPDYIYEEIRNTSRATFVKLCDRIANIESGGKKDTYRKENPHFKKMLYTEIYDEMFQYIEELIDDKF